MVNAYLNSNSAMPFHPAATAAMNLPNYADLILKKIPKNEMMNIVRFDVETEGVDQLPYFVPEKTVVEIIVMRSFVMFAVSKNLCLLLLLF